MQNNFDEIIQRRNSDSVKWKIFGDDVLPLWVADMDFLSPQPVIDALAARVQHGVFGYPMPDNELREVIVNRLKTLYDWDVKKDEIMFMPGVVTGFNNVIHALTQPGDAVLMQTPVYPPFLSAPENAKTIRQETLLKRKNGQYRIDFEDFEKQITDETKLFLLCNPHNPVGRVFSEEELSKMAEICLKRDVLICSDEIHCDLIFEGHKHIPIASLSKAAASNTVTLMAPSKTFNIAGLGCSFAIVQNPDLRKKINAAQQGLVAHVNIMGYTAALAAYRDGQAWLDELLVYLQANRDYLVDFVKTNLPGVKMTIPEGTYLAWLDFSALDLPDEPYKFFKDKAKVGLNDGKTFGQGGEGFVRLNFGCPRTTLEDALKRLQEAVFPS